MIANIGALRQGTEGFGTTAEGSFQLLWTSLGSGKKPAMPSKLVVTGLLMLS